LQFDGGCEPGAQPVKTICTVPPDGAVADRWMLHCATL
jgi:hypothetical protein